MEAEARGEEAVILHRVAVVLIAIFQILPAVVPGSGVVPQRRIGRLRRFGVAQPEEVASAEEQHGQQDKGQISHNLIIYKGCIVSTAIFPGSPAGLDWNLRDYSREKILGNS